MILWPGPSCILNQHILYGKDCEDWKMLQITKGTKKQTKTIWIFCKLRLTQLFHWSFGIFQGQHLFKSRMETTVKMNLASQESSLKMFTEWSLPPVPVPASVLHLQAMKMLKPLQMIGLGKSKVLPGREWDGRGSSLPWVWNINHPGMKTIWGCKCRGILLVQLSFPLPGGNRAINALQTQDKQHKEWFIPSASHSCLFLVISSLQNARVWAAFCL